MTSETLSQDLTPELSDLRTSKWNHFEKIGFRFIFVFFLLFIILENNGAFPFWYLLEFLYDGIGTVVPWVGKNILGITREIDVAPNGSGDTTMDYILVFCIFIVSCIGCVIWTLLDRKRINYNTLYYWLTVVVRYYVAFMLFMYGMIKIFKLQFVSPDIYRMSEPYGDSTPMGLAWTYFGYSNGYNWFVGIAEVLSLLLLFRRTVTLGAIITLMTALNIAAVNFFFDVPVKILSIALITLSLFLLSRDLHRLWSFFITHKNVHLSVLEAPPVKRKWLRILGVSFKYLLIVYVVGWGTYEMGQRESRDELPKPDWYGVYEINEVIHFNDTISEPHAKIFPWKQVVFSRSNMTYVRMMDDSTGRYSLRIFTPDTTMSFVPEQQQFRKNKHVFRYDFSDSTNIRLTGNLNGDSVSFVLHKLAGDESDFRLDSTGFHWISDKPNNR